MGAVKMPILGRRKTATESSLALDRSINCQRWKDHGLSIRITGKNERRDTLKAGTTNSPLPGRSECSGTWRTSPPPLGNPLQGIVPWDVQGWTLHMRVGHTGP